jgi:Dolichyl-phosphate-mannose-protein mannosyltransferase
LVNAAKFAFVWSTVMLLAAVVLTSAARLRSAEYDEQYTLFLTAGTARPAWPETVFAAGLVRRIQSTQADLASIALDLRAVDVHPPVYFWTFAIWRRIFGPGLFEGRLLSVLCGLTSLAAVGYIARRCGIRPLPAMLLTLGSYGFVYTNAIARGFAPAQTLTLCGFAILIGTRRWCGRLAAGALFGAACCCNYLAVFVAVAASTLAGGWLILPAAAPFLALNAWFFAGQADARVGQFPPFTLPSALSRLLVYQVANIFGGLPLYVDRRARIIVTAAIGSLTLALLGSVIHARPLSKVRSADGPPIHLLLAAAVAPPVGLLLLGAAFNNTPTELRYLSFGVPFIALLIAWATTPGPRPATGWRRSLLIAVASAQILSIIGLVSAPSTMQPARATAAAAERLAAGNAVIVLPRGNDGVGIVGAFGIEGPADMPLLLVRPTDSPALIRTRTLGYRRVVLALVGQDRDSIASLPVMLEAFASPGWRRVGTGFNVEVYERLDGGRGSDVLRGFYPGACPGAGRRNPAEAWWLRSTLAAAARQSADACDVAPGRPHAGETLHSGLP